MLLRNATLTIKLDPQAAALAERYLNILEGSQQHDIDAATEALTSATERLKQSNDKLQEGIK